jgi:hypothetical protein
MTQAALAQIVQAIAAIRMPETSLSVDTKAIAAAIKGISFPDHPGFDVSPIVDAISKVQLNVSVPEAKETQPTPYTFTIVRNENGVMTGVVAVPGLEKKQPVTSGGTYE